LALKSDEKKLAKSSISQPHIGRLS